MTGWIGDQSTATLEHVVLVGSAGGPRPRESLVERLCEGECRSHFGHLPDIPARQIGVEGVGENKETALNKQGNGFT